MPSSFVGLHPSYCGTCTCEDCGHDALYEEFIIAEGYPDAHTEWRATCPHCGHTDSSLDN